MSKIIGLKGLEAGGKYALQWLRMQVWADRTGNEEARKALTHIAAMVLKELADEVGDFKQAAEAAMVTYLLTGRHDPMEGSRHETQAAVEKWGRDCDTWWESQR